MARKRKTPARRKPTAAIHPSHTKLASHEIPAETPRLLASGIGTIIAILGITGAWTAHFASMRWIDGLYFLGSLGPMSFFGLYGACAIVFSHHLTHFPRTFITYIAHLAVFAIGVWSLTQGIRPGAFTIGGVFLGFAWLHYVHRLGQH